MKCLIQLCFFFVLFLTTLPAFSQRPGYYPKGGPDMEAEEVSLVQLIANPQAYDNKIVRVLGFLHLEFEGNAIYLHREDFEHDIDKDAIWINLPKDITAKQAKTVNDQYVICTARFRAGQHGHMGLFSGEFDGVTRLESWPYRPHPLPPPRPPVH